MTRDRRDGAAGCDLHSLAAYCAGEAGPAERDQVAAHLVECERCWDEVRISRAAVTAVHRLHEPAPTALRADVRDAIAAAARSGAARRTHPAHRLVMIAAAVAVLILVGVTVAAVADLRGTSGTTTPAAAGPVRAAVQRFGGALPRTAAVPAAPDLSGVGLRQVTAGVVDVGGVRAACYVYTAVGGTRLEVFVGDPAWARPAGARTVGGTAWATTRRGLTVIGGPDQARDQMLVITHDRATAESAAASLGVT